MTHLSEGTLQELVDGQLCATQRRLAEEHLGACAECAAEVAAMRTSAVRATAVMALDTDPVPILRAGAELHRRRKAPVGSWVKNALPRAAAVVLLAASSGAAFALPNSPVRGWIRTFSEAVRSDSQGTEPDPAGIAAAAPVKLRQKAVSILPADGEVRVVIAASSAELRVHVRLSDKPEAEVRATGAAASARFRTAPGLVEIHGAGPGEIMVELPLDATSAFVMIDGRVYAAKDGNVLRRLQPSAGGSAAEPVFRAGS